MKKFLDFLIQNFVEGSFWGVVLASIFIFILVFVGAKTVFYLSERSNPVCKYIGSFWVDDSQDPTRDGDLRGCFTMEEMIGMGRL